MEDRYFRKLGDVCVMPYLFREGSIFGGIEAGKACVPGRLRPGEVPLARPAEVVRIPGNHLYAGPLWNHFGHIFADCIHRLWAWDGSYDAIVFNGMIGLRGVRSHADLQTWQYPAYVDELLALMGIRAKIHIVRGPTVFEKLAVPAPGYRLEHGVEPFYRPVLKRYQERVEAAVAHQDAPDRLYYSRTHLIPGNGGIIGSSYLEHVLRENGFQVCQPEALPLTRQFANVLKSRVLVFDEGSSVHLTSILHAIPPKMYMFPRRKDVRAFTGAMASRGSLTVLADAENLTVLKDRQGREVPHCSCMYTDFEKVYAAMRDNGLVAGSFNRTLFRKCAVRDFQALEAGFVGVSAPIPACERFDAPE